MARVSYTMFKFAKRILRRTVSPIYRISARHKIAMFHTGRSGSTVLGGMLHEHSQIYWAGEILASQKVRLLMQGDRNFNYETFLQDAEFDTLRPYYGIEMKPSDLQQLDISLAQFISHLREVNYTHFIVLERHNLLRRYLSYLIAKRTGHFHLKNNAPSHIQQISIDIPKLIPKLDTFSSYIIQFKEHLKDVPYLSLTYEEDIEHDPSVAYHKVCSYLNVSPRSATPGIQRINPYPLNELIINYEEVVRLLRNTPYAWMTEVNK